MTTNELCKEMNITIESGKQCMCRVNVTLDEDWEGDVYLYYGLENFYQNHRRYVKSRDDNQLLGKLDVNSVDSNCAPFDKDIKNNKYYLPCGAIANSLFSGT